MSEICDVFKIIHRKDGVYDLLLEKLKRLLSHEYFSDEKGGKEECRHC